MRIPMRAISLASASLAVTLLTGISVPTFASGDDEAPAPNSAIAKNAAPAPDREKKVYTNDDIDRMWPKPKLAVVSTSRAQSQPVTISRDRAAAVAFQPLSPERNPLWYASQVAALEDELASLATQEERLREFRTSGSTDTVPGTRNGLQLNAPCEGFTTDNQISNLAQRRADIQQQIAALEDTAQQNDMPPAVIRDAPEILAAAQTPLKPAEERMLLAERQAQLADELNATQNELTGMSEQATALGANLQPPTPGFGGNMTTDLIQRLNNRASAIQGTLDQSDEAARQLGPGQR